MNTPRAMKSKWVAFGLLLLSTSALAQNETTSYPLDGSFPVPNSTPAPYATPYSRPAYSDQYSNSNKQQSFFAGLEAGVQVPVVMGSLAQAFNQGIGFHGAVLFNLVDHLRTGLYVGYQNMPLRADVDTSFRIIPVLAQVGLAGRTFIDEISTTFDVGLGGAFGYLNVPNSATFQVNGYFTAQLQPGLEFNITNEFVIFTRVPVTFLVGSKQLSYVAYDFGLKFLF